MATIYAKLLKAQQNVGAIGKSGFNNHFRYKFAEEHNVLRVAREAFADAGLAFFYSVLSVSDREVTVKSGAQELLTDVVMLCTIFDAESGEKIEGQAIGRGQDGQDKGVNKAIVAGLKYWFMKVLMVSTEGDDTERDEHTNKSGNAPKPEPVQNAGTPPTGTFDLSEIVTGKKAKGRSWVELILEDPSYVEWMLKNYTSLSDEARTKIRAALDAGKIGSTDDLRTLLDKAKAMGVVNADQVKRTEDVIALGESAPMAAAMKWLNEQTAKRA